MIVDITIENFLSIKDRQTFSLYAESNHKHLNNNIAYPKDKKIGVLRSSGIYGANASGKSNLLLAIEALKYITCNTGDLKDGDDIPCYEPYRLSNTTKSAPTFFEIEFFTVEKERFIYSVQFNSKSILQESLDFYPNRQKANIFNRTSTNWEDIGFGGHYKGGRKKFALFSNNSYLSKAGNSADSPEIIRSVYSFFRKNIFHLGTEEILRFVLQEDHNENFINKISNILSKIDTGISGIEFKKNKSIDNIQFPENISDKVKKKILEGNKTTTLFLHKTENNDFEKFNEKIESSGTKKIYNMLPLLILAFDQGGVFILDELDNSFHPHIAELIIKLFNDPSVNRKNSQLIFSTHNINLMSPELLRRDQIWFTEKHSGKTTFNSLDDYDKSMVKINSPYSKWYDEGRFGAVPSIDFFGIASILRVEESINGKVSKK